ncbi:U3 snoRNA-associated small subunit rRNA processing associated protein, putative [Plasmodium gallinaceum]|uniref:U3 snoRNA-associated small subunit rRNA processing associated protein, putative n=1 Tax=Plasmodium gallinaceum TaxID=5849 RepID=A0A1J1GVL7_PLAGA|nr:U3 snoRNA-associated small subunit rRNA processing associated protein, putative [Plasmodium gallinaceum]CRG95059.1 U3 snoRNA-associated small subunit rRNA processing associated protein, putative [Plasmodium gallinaceum]
MTAIYDKDINEPGNILNNLYGSCNSKTSVSLADFNFYETEKKELNCIQISPCKTYMSISDSFCKIYIYKILKNEFLYIQKVDIYCSSTIKSIMWISKKNKRDLFMNNEFNDYLLAISTLCGSIIFYNLENKNIVHKILSNGSISCCKLNNSLQYFGLSNLNGYFYLYNIYKNEENTIYNCFDKFYENYKEKNNINLYSQNKKIKLSNDLSSYLNDYNNNEIINTDKFKDKNDDFINEKENNNSLDVFNIYIKNKIKCKEKLVCIYFMDVLKKRSFLLKKLDDLKKKKDKKKRKSMCNVNTEENENEENKCNSKEKSITKKNKEKKKLKKKINSIEKSYDSYNHYVLLGSDNSKIYKYNLSNNKCVGEFLSMNKNCVIWDIMYIYKTDEVVCVDNSGSLIIFDNKSYSIKYHFNNHNYKSISLTKSLNEESIYSAGIDRYIIKYSLTNLKSNNNENNFINNEDDFIEGDDLKKFFFFHKIKLFRKLNNKWYFICKQSAHISDIKKIICLNTNYILSISDDLTFCVHDVNKSWKKYYSITDISNNKNVMFSSNLKSILCVYSKKINIYYNNHYITKKKKSEKINYNDISYVNPSNYKCIANISYEENEFINSCSLNKKSNKIACITNRNFSLYHFDIDSINIFNYDLSNINFFKVYDFIFLNSNLIIISLIRQNKKHNNEGEIKDENNNLIENYKEDKIDIRNKTLMKNDEKFHVIFNSNINENLNMYENNFSYHVIIYNIKKKTIKEDLKVDNILCNFKKHKKGLIVCSDYKKNIYAFFKNSKQFLKNRIVLNNFNLMEENTYRSYLFYIVIEDFFFVFTLENSIYIYSINFNLNRIDFLKRIHIEKYNFNEFSEITLLNLKTFTRIHNIEKIKEKQKNVTIKKKDEITKHSYLKYNYCLILKSHNKVELVGLNIFDDSIIDIKISNVHNLLSLNNNTFDQYYLSSLNFKYNFLNIKQMYFQDLNIYTMIQNEIKRRNIKSDILNSNNNVRKMIEQTKDIHITSDKNMFDLFDLSFKKITELKKKNIINIHFLYTNENNIIILICVPKNIDNSLINVADTKKYAF